MPDSGARTLTLSDVCDHDFVFLSPRWSCRRAAALLELLHPSHAILEDPDDGDAYHLLSAGEVRSLLDASSTAASVTSLLPRLPADSKTVSADADLPAWDSPSRCVVSADGAVVGFFAADRPPSTNPRHTWEASAVPDAPCFFNASMPGRVSVGTPVSLLVSLTWWPEEGAAATPLDLVPGDAVEVVARPLAGLRVEGPLEVGLVVSDEERGLPARFRLVATEAGPCKVEVLAFRGTHSLGRLVLMPTAEPAEAASSRSATPPPPLSHRTRLTQPVAEAADLTLTVVEIAPSSGPSTRLLFRLSGRHRESSVFGPIGVRDDAEEYIASLYPDLAPRHGHVQPDGEVIAARLAQRGAYLLEMLVPEELRRILWAHRERICSMQILSERPSGIPWELCRLQIEEDGRKVDGPFVGEAFAVTRGILGHSPAPREIRLDRVALICDRDSEDFRSEVARLCELAPEVAHFEPLPMGYLSVLDALTSEDYTAIHFTGHGTAPDRRGERAYLQLRESSDERLYLEDLSGKVRNFGRRRPLVFLNACDTARVGGGLTDFEGWAHQFLAMGVGVFIGTHWPVRGRAATELATVAYGELLKGRTVGEAVRTARLAARQVSPGDASWLAYSVFAHPQAALASAQTSEPERVKPAQ